MQVCLPMRVLLAGCLASAGCVDDDDDDGADGPADGLAAARFSRVDLVSNVPARAERTDERLVNAWGLARGPDTPWWVANQGSATLTIYDGEGRSTGGTGGAARIVDVPAPEGGDDAEPTGLAYNDSDGFGLPGTGTTTFATRFVVATLQGTIVAWSPDTHPEEAELTVDRSDQDAVYTGLALAALDGEPRLYAADFANARIDLFDGAFDPIEPPATRFVDDALPDGFAPYGVHALDEVLYVTYARRDPDGLAEITGPGEGYVVAYDAAGRWLRRVAERGALDAPWGVAIAPEGWDDLAGVLLVGNFGDGRVLAFSAEDDAPLGELRGEGGAPLVIDGLWGLAADVDDAAAAPDRVYFTAGPDGEANGLFGYLERTR